MSVNVDAQTVRCRRCGSTMKAARQVCPICGASLPAVQESPAAPAGGPAAGISSRVSTSLHASAPPRAGVETKAAPRLRPRPAAVRSPAENPPLTKVICAVCHQSMAGETAVPHRGEMLCPSCAAALTQKTPAAGKMADPAGRGGSAGQPPPPTPGQDTRGPALAADAAARPAKETPLPSPRRPPTASPYSAAGDRQALVKAGWVAAAGGMLALAVGVILLVNPGSVGEKMKEWVSDPVLILGPVFVIPGLYCLGVAALTLFTRDFVMPAARGAMIVQLALFVAVVGGVVVVAHASGKGLLGFLSFALAVAALWPVFLGIQGIRAAKRLHQADYGQTGNTPG